jgi:D-alanyl-D-alanine carboxypeptidase (penicillin-binding protein 5/6)
MGSHHPRLAAAAAVLALSGFAVSAFAMPATAAADEVLGGAQLGQPGFVVDTTPGVPPLPATTATSFVVADADTGQVLAAHNAHQKLAPASTLKTLTALTLLPRLTPFQTTVAKSDAPSVDGTKAGIVAGTIYTVDNLFTAMLMMSANDAAVSLADANGGVPATIDQMNALATHLQADDTVAKTTNGLDAAGQSSSAYDLALIFRAGLAVPQFKHYLALKSAAFPAPKASSFQIQTHDRLLTEYAGMIGGKNGYTVAAQASYVGAATRGGHTIIVSVMRDQANFWPEVKTLLDWGFKADAVVTPVGELVGPYVPTPTAEPTPTEAVVAAPVPAAVVPVAAPKADLHRAGNGSGVGISGVMIWSAVGAAALFFVAGAWQLAVRRRRRSDTDERYLRGLSRLSAGDEVASR